MKRVGEIVKGNAMVRQAEGRAAPRGDRYNLAKQIGQLYDIGQGEDDAEKGFAARLMFHAMLPHSAQKGSEWSRSNGRRKLYMQAGPGLGLPYGTYPRLLLLWIITEAVRTQNRTLILGDSLSGFMEQLGLEPTGGRWGTITQLREQMKRLMACRIVAYEYLEQQGKRAGEGMTQMHVADDVALWWDPQSPEQGAMWESRMTLGERFYAEIVTRPFPFDMRILRAVKRSPLGIDLYTTLTYRVSYMKQATAISWEQLHGQLGAEYGNVHEFTRKAKRELTKLKLAWPQLQYATPRGRLLLYPSSPSVAKTIEGKRA